MRDNDDDDDEQKPISMEQRKTFIRKKKIFIGFFTKDTHEL
mgnify:CR=1 FL=1